MKTAGGQKLMLSLSEKLGWLYNAKMRRKPAIIVCVHLDLTGLQTDSVREANHTQFWCKERRSQGTANTSTAGKPFVNGGMLIC